MAKWHWALASAASGATLLGLASTSGLVVLANHFIDELTLPGPALDDSWGIWQVPDPERDPPPELQRSLTFRSPGGPLLRGDFWAQPHPAPTMLIAHGYRVSRANLRNVAALEYHNGANVLLFDFRGHGESEMVPTSGGNAEVRDLEAAIDQAIAQPETLPGQIFIHGFSMGAAIALLTPPRPEIAGIIADSPYARLDEMLCRLICWRLREGAAHWQPRLRPVQRVFPALAQALVSTSTVVFRLRYHAPLIARPDAAVGRHWPKERAPARTTPIPILLIHALDDPLVPIAHARRLVAVAEASHVPLQTHFVACTSHCGAYGADPVGYVDAIQHFVARYAQR